RQQPLQEADRHAASSSPPADKTESKRSCLIVPLLQLRERAVGDAQVAFDRAQADAELLGHLSLRHAVDPVSAEDLGDARGLEPREKLGYQPDKVPRRDLSI